MKGRILPAGDAALVVEFGEEIEETTNQRVQQLACELKQIKIDGIREVLPTFRSLMIFYDPQKQSYRKLEKRLKKWNPESEAVLEKEKKILKVPCCYGGEYGPDLQPMESILHMTSEEIIKLHTGVNYRIYMLGFLPGFVYLGGMPKEIETPRLQTPRTVIPARSVGIGGSQTGVYPMESPGGWRLIGRTPLEFYDSKREKAALCNAGEYIRFSAVSKPEYEEIRQEVEKGIYKPEYMYER